MRRVKVNSQSVKEQIQFRQGVCSIECAGRQRHRQGLDNLHVDLAAPSISLGCVYPEASTFRGIGLVVPNTIGTRRAAKAPGSRSREHIEEGLRRSPGLSAQAATAPRAHAGRHSPLLGLNLGTRRVEQLLRPAEGGSE